MKMVYYSLLQDYHSNLRLFPLPSSS